LVKFAHVVRSFSNPSDFVLTMVFLIINAKNDRRKYVDSIIAVVQDDDIEKYIENTKETINAIAKGTPVAFIDAEIIKTVGIDYNLIRALTVKSIHEMGEPCTIVADLYYRWFPVWIPG
jgi:7-cyano-7-deazaguanine synthase in queuosine biosynthesis